MATARITVRLDGKLHRRLSATARARGKSESDIVRAALEEHLQGNGQVETCFDIAKRMKLIGAAKGLPKDLSTNPRYFEGFGT
jgi:predicted DNA-binding protein